jgi:hypothetical protein
MCNQMSKEKEEQSRPQTNNFPQLPNNNMAISFLEVAKRKQTGHLKTWQVEQLKEISQMAERNGGKLERGTAGGRERYCRKVYSTQNAQ